jgi:leader peptidase (prepilin peptidase)/N-methyltransferase
VERLSSVPTHHGQEGRATGISLLAALGAWLGWQMVLPVILLAAGVEAIVGC